MESTINWHSKAYDEIVGLAKSDGVRSAALVGQIYALVSELNEKMVEDLSTLPARNRNIRYWDYQDYSVYFRIDGKNSFTVLRVSKVIGALRGISNNAAIARA